VAQNNKLAFSKLPAGMLFVRKSGTILGLFTFKWLKRMSIFVNNPFYMKKQFAPLVLVFILAAFMFSSCGKDDNVITVKTNTQLLTQGTWKFKSATAGGSDASTYLQACQKDNTLTFVAAGTGTVDEGLSKCNSADPQTASLSWNFATGETILHVSVPLFANTGNDLTLVSLSETELIVSIGYAPPVGPIVLVTITFSH
jgi:hypothetical protein